MARCVRRRVRLGSGLSGSGRRMSLTRWIVVVGLMLTFPASAFSQPADPVPRTPWGDPDLQGMWPGGSVVLVPFEHAEELDTRAVFTDEEYATHEQRIAALLHRLATRGTGPSPVFGEVGPPPRQASLVVDPENGRLPSMTDDGARRAKEWRARSAPTYSYASVEDLRPYDRCISRGVLGSAFPNVYASVMWILQTPGFVIISHEMVHETRVIPLDGPPHIPSGIHQWMGDSRGRWDGDTLVVETTNFNGRTGSYWRNGNGKPDERDLAARRAIPFERRQDARLRSAGRGPGDMDTALDGRVFVATGRRLRHLRIRLPRRQLRPH